MGRTRPVYSKDLGDFFRGLREARGWKQAEAASYAERRKLPALSRQVLLRLERGQTKNPEPEVLRALAALYDLAYEDVASRFIRHRYGLSVSASVPPTKTDRADDGFGASVVGEEALGSDYTVKNAADRPLLRDTDIHASYGAPEDLAATRSAIERVLADLTAIAKSLPRRQAAMARGSRSGGAARARRHRGQSDRATTKKAPRR